MYIPKKVILDLKYSLPVLHTCIVDSRQQYINLDQLFVINLITNLESYYSIYHGSCSINLYYPSNATDGLLYY